MRRATALLTAILVLTLLATCSRNEGPEKSVLVERPVSTTAADLPDAGEPVHGGTMVVSYGGGTPRHFNPALVSGSATMFVGAQIFASPLRYDENWNPQPYLAESWEIADDGLSVTLHLRSNAVFHDGTPITSRDVAFSIRVVQENHPSSTMFKPVVGVETPDSLTAVVRLSRPHPAILLAMSPPLLPILPEHVYGDGQDLATHPANLQPVGSGPFRLAEYRPGELIRLERFNDYFLEGQPYLDSVIIRLDPDPVSQAMDMERGEAQILPVYSNLEGLARLAALDDIVITERGNEGLGAINWLAFNLRRMPLAEVRVRQAIAYAVDADFVVNHLHGGLSRRANSPIYPDSPFYDPELPDYAVDLERARKLLDDAGYAPGPDGIRFGLTLDYIPAMPSQQRDVALYLERQLARVGIAVRVRHSESVPEWAARIGNWDFDMTLDIVYNWGDPVIGVHRTYLSSNIRQGVIWSNTQGYSNSPVDAILQRAESEMDPGARADLYSEFQKVVADELPVFWLNTVPLHTAYNPGLGNPPLSIWGVHSPLDAVYWRVPPDRGYAPLSDPGDDASFLTRTGVAAVRVLGQTNLYDALETLRDPAAGFLDMENTGLHVIGLTSDGRVFLDNSGVLRPGTDLSGLRDNEERSIVPILLRAAEGNGSTVTLTGALPHPVSHSLSAMSAWCGPLGNGDIVCVVAWGPEQEHEP